MLTLGTVLQVLSGQEWPGVDQTIENVVVDSRKAGPGALFVALPGETTDGHLYIEDAFSRGAAAALIQRDVMLPGAEPEAAPPQVIDLRGPVEPVEVRLPAVLRVDDSLAAMQRVAQAWRQMLGAARPPESPLRVVGVTGSVGKTTTKELIAAVLQTRYRTLKSEGNLNNEIGLPLSLLRLTEEHERAVLEMGFYVPGEIAMLCDLAQPHVGVVTNVLPVHVERAGSLEAVAQGKGELVEALPPEGVAVLNYDDPLVIDMARRTKARVISYGLNPAADVWASDIEGLGLEGIRFQLHHQGEALHVKVPHLGRHSVHTSLRAAAVGLAEGLTWQEIVEGLTSGAQLRLYAVTGPKGSILLDDTYNAAAESVIAALNLLKELEGRKIAVLGDMLELGDYTVEQHERVGRYAREVVDVLVTVGRLGGLIAAEALHSGMKSNAIVALPDVPAAIEYLRGQIGAGDAVLIKGSRGLHMETIVNALEAGE